MASSSPSAASSKLSFVSFWKQLRPKQWAKNAIVFAPILFSGKCTDPDSAAKAILCAVAFCLVSSAIYTINDILDIKSDRAHPKKQLRPIASGQIGIGLAVSFSLLLAALGFALAFVVRPTLDLICLVYILINLLYSFSWKNHPVIDVLSIASGFVLRAVAGAVAIHVPASGWFLMCTTFGALFLALEKRSHEIRTLTGNSSEHRKALSEYSNALIQRYEGLVTPCLLTSYAFYTLQSFHGQWMMITIPMVLYGVMRYQFLSERGEVTGTPEEILWKDRPIQLTLLLWVAACAVVVYGQPSYWLKYIAHAIDSLKYAH